MALSLGRQHGWGVAGMALVVAPQVPEISVANALSGAVLLGKEDKGVNETYVGVIETASEQRRAYLKVLDSKQLVNELICSTLGRAVGLPVPEGYLVRANPVDFPDSDALSKHGREALIFGCADVGHPSLARRLTIDGRAYLLQLFAAWSAWDTTAIFDEWIANQDRHPGNLLIETDNKVWLIDHGHAMTGSAWKAADLVPGFVGRNQIVEVVMPALTLPGRVNMKVKTQETASIFSMVSAEAATKASLIDDLLDATELSALQDFIRKRSSKVVELMSSKLGLPSLV